MVDQVNNLRVNVTINGPRDAIAQLARLESQIDGVSAAQTASIRAQAAYNNSVARLNGANNSLRASNDNVTASVGAYRAGMQNLGFQLQDVAVQVAGGTSAFRAFGQQFPQALGAISQMTGATSKLGLFLGGPWGIALGVAAAALAPLIERLFEAKDAAEETETALTKAYKAIIDAGNKTTPLTDLFTAASNTIATASAKEAAALRDVAFWREQANVAARTPSQGPDRVIRANEQAAAAQARANAARAEIKDAQAKIDSALSERRATEIAASQKAKLTTETEKSSAARQAETKAIEAQTKALTTQERALQLLQQTKDKLDADRAEAAAAGLALSELNQEIDRLNAVNRKTQEQIGILENLIAVRRRLRNEMSLPSGSAPVSSDVIGQGPISIDFPEIKPFDPKPIADAERAFTQLETVAINSISGIGQGFEAAINGAQSFAQAMDQVARSVVADLTEVLAKMALISLFNAAFGLNIPGGFSKGGVFENGNVTPFARGGVISQPTFFPMRSGVGLMGEAGPEAIMPLRRTSSGDLGVRSSAPRITVNNYSGQLVEIDQRGDETIIMIAAENAKKMVAADIRRGDGDVARSMQSAYGLGRARR